MNGEDLMKKGTKTNERVKVRKKQDGMTGGRSRWAVVKLVHEDAGRPQNFSYSSLNFPAREFRTFYISTGESNYFLIYYPIYIYILYRVFQG